MSILVVIVASALVGVFAWGAGLSAAALTALAALTAAGFALAAWARLGRALQGRVRGSWWQESLGHQRQLAAELHEEAEDGRFERAHARLRWLGLTELWTSIHRVSAPAQFDDRILRFLRQESGFSRCAILHVHAGSGEVSGHWQSGGENSSRLEPLRWSLPALGGDVAECLRATRAVLSSPESKRDLLTVGGMRPASIPQATSYVVLPLLGQSSPATCLVSGWLHRPMCKDYTPLATPTPHAANDPGLRQCLSCRHYPVLGALVFQSNAEEDLAREAQRLMPLATMVSALLEHRALHRRTVEEDRLREGMLDAMWNGLVGTDGRGRIHFSNRRARELAMAEQWEGRSLSEFLELPEPDALGRALVEGVPYTHSDARLIRADLSSESAERRLPVRIAIHPISPGSGSRAGVLCVLEDRSQVQALEDEVRHLDTLAAMGRFASALAHEIRNPLAGIQAGIGYLRREPRGSEETLDVMEGEIVRVDGILRSLLSVAKPQELQLRPCRLRALCDKVAASQEARASESQIHLQVEGEEVEVLADEAMLHQVLLNLVKNAIEATGSRGLVRVLLRSPGGERSEIEARPLQVLVEDSGPGIDAELIDRLFEPFVSAKAQGTGLGLYVCHNFVERHGGRLSAENLADGGARFTVELPAVPALIGG